MGIPFGRQLSSVNTVPAKHLLMFWDSHRENILSIELFYYCPIVVKIILWKWYKININYLCVAYEKNLASNPMNRRPVVLWTNSGTSAVFFLIAYEYIDRLESPSFTCLLILCFPIYFEILILRKDIWLLKLTIFCLNVLPS